MTCGSNLLDIRQMVDDESFLRHIPLYSISDIPNPNSNPGLAQQHTTNEKLQLHVMDCGKMNDCVIRLPSVDEKCLEFGNHCNKERVPFIVYVDLEYILRKTKPDKEYMSSYAYQRHEIFSIGYCVLDDALLSYQFHRYKDYIFVELRAKMYAVRVDGKNDTKKEKGIKNNISVRHSESLLVFS
ncbi:hypothetical protein ALC56_09923 [Trachymyrmex septentrionalis]|uniref:Uncharacterized protein n=1 Tax=Trachymyrmex septentrionalis TaxID=34720 RepID=A0A195F5I4_9HYME|nr:hypothetical protein ALC56_09923 [Trachymyrmex septentrionalis]